MLARIRTDSPSEVSKIAEVLRARGYEVEVVSKDFETPAVAEIEIAAQFLPAQEALAQALQLADKTGCDLLIAPGALDSIAPVQNKAAERPLLSSEVVPSLPVPEVSSAHPAVPQPSGPHWTRRALDMSVKRSAEFRGLIERLAEVAARVGSQGWKASCRSGIWMAGKARTGSARFGVASRSTAASAADGWKEARHQYARIRAATAAKAAQIRADRRQVKAAKARVAVEVLETTVPLPQAPARGWRAALAGAAMAALVIGVGFSVGAGRTPAASPSLTRPSTSAALVTTTRVSPSASAVTGHKPRAARTSSTAAKPKRKHVAEPDDTQQEVIVRHFAPVKSTPAVSADGVHRYSDTDQR